MDEAADGAAMDSSAEVKEQLIKAAAKIILSVIVVILVTAYFAWPSSTALAKKLLTKMRRSVVKYKGPAPAAAVQRAFEAAIHAPNHFLNEPWRFRVLGKATVKKIIALNDSKKDLFEEVPGWLMVSVVPTAGDTKWNPKALEDHAATSCAVQNFMLSLASEGLGSKWMTGALGIPPPKLMELVGADESKEHFMGIVWFGAPAAPTATMAVPKRKTGLAEPILTTLP